MRQGDLIDGRYELTEPLPDRGAGELWRARDTRLRGAEVTLARVASSCSGEVSPTPRRLTELRHESVLAVLRHGAQADVVYVVYEPFEAPSLAVLLAQGWREGAPLVPKVLERIADRVCDALEAAHALSPPLIHGALSTRSVLVQTVPKVVVRVADFALGGGDGADVRGDLVALGTLLREMFAVPEAPGLPPPPQGRDWRRDDLPDALWEVAVGACAGSFASVEPLRAALEAAWRSPVTGPAPRIVVAPEATDGAHAAPTEVTFRRPASDVPQHHLRPSNPSPTPEESRREPTVMLDVGWPQPSSDGTPADATSRSFHLASSPAALDDATERKRVEPPMAAHRAVVADTEAVSQAGLPSPPPAASTPVDPTRLAIPLPTAPTQPVAAPEPPPSLSLPPATDAHDAPERRHTWVVAALFVALFVGVAALVALR